MNFFFLHTKKKVWLRSWSRYHVTQGYMAQCKDRLEPIWKKFVLVKVFAFQTFSHDSLKRRLLKVEQTILLTIRLNIIYKLLNIIYIGLNKNIFHFNLRKSFLKGFNCIFLKIYILICIILQVINMYIIASCLLLDFIAIVNVLQSWRIITNEKMTYYNKHKWRIHLSDYD